MLTVPYGDPGGAPIADRVGDLRVPEGPGPQPIAVVIHGGLWQAQYTREQMDGICEDLARRGWASWNIEYRRVGAGGGWPATFEDVAAAVDQVATFADEHGLDLTRTVTIGHSAGGHLALWAAVRHNIPAGAPGAEPRVRPRLAIAQAGLGDLKRAAREQIGGSAVPDLMGGSPDEQPGRYAVGSPLELLPAGAPTVLIHGVADHLIPVSHSQGFVDAARRHGDDSELVTVEGGHFEHLDPTTAAWAAAVERIEAVR